MNVFITKEKQKNLSYHNLHLKLFGTDLDSKDCI